MAYSEEAGWDSPESYAAIHGPKEAMTLSCPRRENVKNLESRRSHLAQFQTGHTHSAIRQSGGRSALLSRRLGDQIEGRHVDNKKPDHPREPALIRQKHPPVSIQDAKPTSGEGQNDKRTVRCRHILRAGRPKVVLLTEAKPKFQSHAMKCQECKSRPLCAGA